MDIIIFCFLWVLIVNYGLIVKNSVIVEFFFKDKFGINY